MSEDKEKSENPQNGVFIPNRLLEIIDERMRNMEQRLAKMEGMLLIIDRDKPVPWYPSTYPWYPQVTWDGGTGTIEYGSGTTTTTRTESEP